MVETSIKEKEMLLLSRQGNQQVFRKLVETYQGYAFSLAVRYLGNEEDARDVVQDTFIRIWKRLSTFDFRCKFTTWMYRIVINLCHDRNKALNRQKKFLDFNSLGDFPDLFSAAIAPIDLENESIRKELGTIIAALAGELPPRQRSIFVLRDLQDLSVAEVSQILRISKNSVKSNLSHARQKIRKRLEQIEKNGRDKNEM
jgi:RNA polymerase sigma-70 factor (ECF subfamily)